MSSLPSATLSRSRYNIRELSAHYGNPHQLLALEGAPAEVIHRSTYAKVAQDCPPPISTPTLAWAAIYRAEIENVGKHSSGSCRFLGLFAADGPHNTLIAAAHIGSKVMGQRKGEPSAHARFHLLTDYRYKAFPNLATDFNAGISAFVHTTVEAARGYQLGLDILNRKRGKVSCWLPTQKPLVRPNTPFVKTLQALLLNKINIVTDSEPIPGYLLAQHSAQ